MIHSGIGKSLAVLLSALVVVFAGHIGAEAASPGLSVVPESIGIGAFFQGKDVKVSGVIPQGAQALVEVMGNATTQKLLRKGRRAGLWMSVGEIVIKDAPSLYLAMSTGEELLSMEDPRLQWGYQALMKKLTFKGQLNEQEQREFKEQFIQLKESEKLYALLPGALEVSQLAGGKSAVKGSFHVPSAIKPDTYTVRLSAVRDKKILARQSAELKVEMVGFPKMMASLAYNHKAVYGILAVIIASITGFIIGLLFKKGGGAH